VKFLRERARATLPYPAEYRICASEKKQCFRADASSPLLVTYESHRSSVLMRSSSAILLGLRLHKFEAEDLSATLSIPCQDLGQNFGHSHSKSSKETEKARAHLGEHTTRDSRVWRLVQQSSRGCTFLRGSNAVVSCCGDSFMGLASTSRDADEQTGLLPQA